MSFDLYFVDRDQPYEQSMERLEEVGGSGALSGDHREIWNRLFEGVQREMPQVTVTEGSRHLQLEDPETLAQLFFAEGQLSAHVPHWYDQCCAGAERGAALATYASVVEDVTGLVAFDPQTGGRYSQFSVQWFDHDPWRGQLVTYVSPERADMTALRKLKDPDSRRNSAYRIAATATDEWIVHPQRDALFWLTELTFEREPYEPKKDQIAFRYGQRMHRRLGFRLDLIRNVPDLLLILQKPSDKQIRKDVLARKSTEFVDAKVGPHPHKGQRELLEFRVDNISEETADAVVRFRRQVVDLFEAAESSKRKVLTLSRWKGSYPPN